jgi:NAD(P)H dehydrogenase (quinone)
MNVLVVYAHPHPLSLVGALRDIVLEELQFRAHEVRQHDLYAENFNPVMTGYERQNHSTAIAPKLKLMPELRSHIDDLQWCDALVLVYPTWWSGQPAILKGWFDRVFVNEVAWELPEGANRLQPRLTNIRRLVVVTTHGSSKLVNAIQGESGKRLVLRSVRLMMNWRTRTSWIALYGLDFRSEKYRQRMLNRVRRRIRRL